LIATDAVSTTGAPVALRVSTSRKGLTADGEDCAMIEVALVDAQGRVVPTASDLVRFSVSGPAKIAGVGNGDPSCHEPDRAAQRHAFHGLCLGIVQAQDRSGKVVVTVSAPGLQSAKVKLDAKR
jgi:beta-galactosidase